MADNKTETKKREGRKSYNSTVLWAKREKKRADAEARQTVCEALSFSQRIDLARKRRGESKREIARLTEMIAKAKEKKPEVVPAATVAAAPPATEVKPKKKPYQKPKRS